MDDQLPTSAKVSTRERIRVYATKAGTLLLTLVAAFIVVVIARFGTYFILAPLLEWIF